MHVPNTPTPKTHYSPARRPGEMKVSTSTIAPLFATMALTAKKGDSLHRMRRNIEGLGCLLGICPEFARNLPEICSDSEFARNFARIRSENGPDQPCAELSKPTPKTPANNFGTVCRTCSPFSSKNRQKTARKSFSRQCAN